MPAPAPVEAKVWGQAIFLLTPQLFLKFFSGRVAYDVTENPIPADAKIIDIRMDKWNKRNEGGIIEVLVSHHSIAPVADGKELPMFKAPKFTRIGEPAAGAATEPVAGL